MALKQSNLQQIPQRNKDVAFGYVKECEKKNKQVIPSMIKYLCLIYFNQTKDQFDIKNTHSKIKVDGNCIKIGPNRDASDVTYNSYLENIVNKGIHIWRFKCNKSYDVDQIGIRNVEMKDWD